MKNNQQTAVKCNKCNKGFLQTISEEQVEGGIKFIAKCDKCGETIALFVPQENKEYQDYLKNWPQSEVNIRD